MKLCEVCHNAEVMPIPLKDAESIGVKLPGSTSGTLTFFYPTTEGKLCFYCSGRKTGRISKLEHSAQSREKENSK